VTTTVVSATPPSAPGRRPLGQLLRAYVALTKPRIIELLLVTTVPAMILARRGMPSWWLVAATLIGGTFAAGSANTINCFVDRDIDQVMRRTSRLKAHDEQNECGIGDRVLLMETRPLSATKRWRVVQVLEKAK